MVFHKTGDLTLKRPGGGFPSTFRAIISQKLIFAHRPFMTFFIQVLRNFWRYFCKKLAVPFQSYPTLCNRASAQNMEIFWICVQNIWKMAFCAKKSILGSKSVLFVLILVNITVIYTDYQYFNNSRWKNNKIHKLQKTKKYIRNLQNNRIQKKE